MPQALALVSLVATTASGIYSAVSSSNTADYNAAVADQEAQSAKDKATYEESIQRRKTAALISKQRALYAGAGVDVDSGSPLTVLQETAAEGEMDALAIRYGGELESVSKKNQTKLYKQQGRTSLITGLASTTSSALSSYGNYKEKYGNG